MKDKNLLYLGTRTNGKNQNIKLDKL